MSELLLHEDALVVPRAQGLALTLDMRKIHKAEARLVELQGVTKQKAGELFHCFIEAFGEAKSYLAQLRVEYGRAKQRTRQTRGIIVLDKAVDALKAKGLLSTRSPAGSEDMRDAIVETSQEYIEVFDRFSQVEAALEHMEGKVEKLKMAYYAISDLIKGTDLTKRETSGGAGDDDPGTLTRAEKLTNFVNEHSVVESEAATYEECGFGTPKF